jgi:hypothetical protein
LFKSQKNVRVSDFEYNLNLFISILFKFDFFQNLNLLKIKISSNSKSEQILGKKETEKKRHLDRPNKKVTWAERTPVGPRAETRSPRVYMYVLMTSSPKQAGRVSVRMFWFFPVLGKFCGLLVFVSGFLFFLIFRIFFMFPFSIFSPI